MRDHHIDLCGQIDFTRTEAMPLLARDAHFSFACNGCGDCCRGREDIVLSGFDLWRIAARLRLPPQIVARGYCRASIGTVSHLPVLRLAPVKENRSATVEKAYGAYTHHELSVLVTVLTRRQALQLRNFLRENDPRSFITIVNSSEIIGKGFRSFN